MYAPNSQHSSNEKYMASISGHKQSAAEENDKLKHQIGSDFLIVNLLRSRNKATKSTTNANRNTSGLLTSTDRNFKTGMWSSLQGRSDVIQNSNKIEQIKNIWKSQNPVVNSIFSYQSEYKLKIEQSVCSEQRTGYQPISSQPANTSVNSSDESKRNSKRSSPFRCFECGKSFTKHSHLQRHWKNHHKQPQPEDHTTRSSRLDLCNFKSSNISEKPDPSEIKAIMKENWSTLISLQVEPLNRVRGIEKPAENYKKDRYECSVCQKTFKGKYSLKIHMRIHTEEKPYECEVCNKSFSQKNNLTRHVRIHTGEKPYKCKVCNESFSQLSTLTDHERTHTGEKPYKCEVCNKTFASRSGLYQHQHDREKQFAEWIGLS